jgi:hypothetical protein
MKVDATIAKNYLTAEEVTDLDRLTSQFLDFAEGQAKRRIATTMEQWVMVTDKLLDANSYPILRGVGKASHEEVESAVDQQWLTFAETRKQREYDEAWQLEADDIGELLQLEQSHKGLDHDG